MISDSVPLLHLPTIVLFPMALEENRYHSIKFQKLACVNIKNVWPINPAIKLNRQNIFC